MAKKHWRELRERKLFTTSGTQHETYERCKRKWWIKWVRKLGEPPRAPTGFGTVLHSVIARYQMADDLGRDRHGQVVDLYPVGWEQPEEKWGGIPGDPLTVVKQQRFGFFKSCEFDDEVIRIFCEQCKGSGQCVYVGGQPPDTCNKCGGDGLSAIVKIMGFIDVVTPDSVQDHKSIKNIRYAKSQKKLASNRQLLIYAKVVLKRLEAQGLPLPTDVLVRHNYFSKNLDCAPVAVCSTIPRVPIIPTAMNSTRATGIVPT